MEIEVNDLSELPEAAKTLIDQYSDRYKVWLFYGEMGAGKTTFIKELCHHANVVDNISSPTFSIVNEYWTESEDVVYHFDFYRIESEREAIDIGLDEYFYSEDLCFVEWPERIPSLIPDEYLEINIKLGDNNQRILSVRPHGGED
ncbi:MAG: tRNA (adenosine(37)-N6)-threonylcarbamoyltransferase complex ATPase subunit type 1 TsaE [bacterium]|nr:tRNA (adenosine(37)-N6)-threonylcarbamoyltransferase complex ATPase subunit type 1 TsaE [bacterium]